MKNIYEAPEMSITYFEVPVLTDGSSNNDIELPEVDWTKNG